MMQYHSKKGMLLVGVVVSFLFTQACIRSTEHESAAKHDPSAKSESPRSYKQLTCFYVNTPIVIDGKLADAGWQWAMPIMLKHDSLSSQDPRRSDNRVMVKTLWDMKNLYIAYRVWDHDLRAKVTSRDGPGLSRDDIVEFLIDPHNKKDSCWGPEDIIYHINLLGETKDDRGTEDCRSDATWNGNARFTVLLSGSINDSTDVDTGYTVEVAVPWGELGIVPSENATLGIDFGNGDSGIFFDWVGAWPFRSPYAFGDLVLKK